MAVQQHHPHMLNLPHFFDILKYIQLALAVLVLGLSAFSVYALPVSAHAYAIFVCLYSLGITIYYHVASKATPKSYSWVALLVLEILAVIFWLATWAVLGALFAALAYVGTYYDSYYYAKRSLEARDAYSDGLGYTGCLIAAIALSVINFILYIITLVFMSRAIDRHRKAGHPILPGTSGSATPAYSLNGNGAASDHEKGTSVPMQPTKTNQE